ncbi:hypothetical protein MFUL124B02_31300 [Myxococcus fulvus 124B02]|nr:hypothetical protein MFUL124B02_31300 [Myxococcus fulvus 124B02]
MRREVPGCTAGHPALARTDSVTARRLSPAVFKGVSGHVARRLVRGGNGASIQSSPSVEMCMMNECPARLVEEVLRV